MNIYFKRLMEKFSYIFADSYGFDKLSKYLIVTGFLFIIFRLSPILGAAAVSYGVWRAFSKNKYRRSNELYTFDNQLRSIQQFFGKYKFKIEQSLHYKIFKCPNCTQKLRVPRKQGKITITCKKCSTKFNAKS
jgi:hypothetical protein